MGILKELETAKQDNEYLSDEDYRVLYGLSNPSTNMNMIVCKSNPFLNLTRSQMSLIALKIFDVYLARINPTDPETTKVVISKKELEQLFGVERIQREVLEKALDGLMGYVVTCFVSPQSKVKVTLLSEARLDYEDESMNSVGQITLQCSPSAKEYIYNIENMGYLKMNLNRLLTFDSRNSYSLYQYLVRNSFRGHWDENLETLKINMGKSGSSYSAWKDFNKRVLIPAKEEIEGKTTLRFEYKPKIKNRKYVGVHFNIVCQEDDERLPFS